MGRAKLRLYGLDGSARHLVAQEVEHLSAGAELMGLTWDQIDGIM